jgi:hypothetical protein
VCRAMLVEASSIPPFRIELDTVGRISDQQLGLVLGEQSRDVFWSGRISAQQAMRTETPQFSQPRHRHFRQRRRLLRFFLVHRIVQKRIELVNVEASQSKIKIEVVQLGQLRGEQILAPGGFLVGAICQPGAGRGFAPA